MSTVELLRAVLSLPEEERAQVAEELLASLEPADAAGDDAWRQAIAARVRDVVEGGVALEAESTTRAALEAHLRSIGE